MPLIILTRDTGKSVLVQTDTIVYAELLLNVADKSTVGTYIYFNADRSLAVKESFHEIMDLVPNWRE
jgi:hypothetical protein